MNIDQDDDNIDDTDAAEANYSMPDPFSLAIELCRVAAKPATYAAALKKLRKLGRDILAAEQKLAALTTEAEQKQAAFAEREAQAAAREAALEAREAAFESQARDVRDELCEHHARLEQTHRVLVHRLMSTAGILGEWNWDLQSSPTWTQVRQMIAGLPDDPPAPVAEPAMRIDALSDTFDDPNADRHGAPFLGELTRSTEHKRKSAA
jgi:hypothetical protein